MIIVEVQIRFWFEGCTQDSGNHSRITVSVGPLGPVYGWLSSQDGGRFLEGPLLGSRKSTQSWLMKEGEWGLVDSNVVTKSLRLVQSQFVPNNSVLRLELGSQRLKHPDLTLGP